MAGGYTLGGYGAGYYGPTPTADDRTLTVEPDVRRFDVPADPRAFPA